MVLDVTMVTFWMTLRMNIVMDNGRVKPLAKPLPSLVNNLWWTMVKEDLKLDEKYLVSDNKCNIGNL